MTYFFFDIGVDLFARISQLYATCPCVGAGPHMDRLRVGACDSV